MRAMIIGLVAAIASSGCGVDGEVDPSDMPTAGSGSAAAASAPTHPENDRPGADLPMQDSDEADDNGFGPPDENASDPDLDGAGYGFDDSYGNGDIEVIGYGDRDGCASPHKMIGWVAELSEIAHDVAGTAEIVDACTVKIHDFHYDGKGGPTQIYGGRDGNWFDGFAMTDLLSKDGYDGETVIAKLPPGIKLDDLDGIAVWCIDQNANFGDGTFVP